MSRRNADLLIRRFKIQNRHLVKILSFSIFLPLLLACLIQARAAVGTSYDATARPGVTLIAENLRHASFAFELPKLMQEEVWHDGERFDSYSFETDPSAGSEGWPDLPSMVRLILIPPQSGVELAVRNIRSHIIPNVNPLPLQPLQSEDRAVLEKNASLKDGSAVLYRDSRADEVEGFWPPEIVRLGKPAIMRGYRLVPVVINPLRYDPSTRELEIVDEFEFELNYNSDLNRDNIVQNPGKARPSNSVNRLIRNIVVNPPDLPERDLGLRGGSILYVLGSANLWNNTLETLTPLIEWRRKMGWTVDVLRVQNPSDANAIRNEISEYYQEAEIPPEHIVICGDTDRDYPIAFFNHANGVQYPYESDHDFTMLEGDDLLPEASVGRLIFVDNARLRDVVTKTVNYEANPLIGEGARAGWQKRAAVEALVPYSSPINVLRWSKRVLTSQGFERVNELYYGENGANDNRSFINQNFDEGLSFFIHRGPLFMNPNFGFGDVAQLRNGRMLPFVLIITCNTGDYGEHLSDGGQGYFNESFASHPNGGAIGAVGSAGATHTAYNNIYVTGTVQSLFIDGISNQGWAHMGGKLALFANYYERGDIPHEENRNMESWLTHFYINNLMGDPAVDLFTDVPRSLTVTRPENIFHGQSRIELTVLHEDDESAARDAVVCLYKPELFQLVASPDEEGRVVFDLDPAWSEEANDIYLTITGHNLNTVFTSYVPDDPESFIGASSFEIDDDREGRSAGNGDGTANQSETIELTVTVANRGENAPQGQMALTLVTDDPNLEILDGELVYEAAPDPGNSVEAQFLVRTGRGFPAGSNASFTLWTSVGEEDWVSSVSFPVEGPDLEVESLEWVNEPLHRGGEAELLVSFRNKGTGPIERFTATFFSTARTIGAIEDQVEYQGVEPDGMVQSDGTFILNAHMFHFGNRPVPCKLAIEALDGFIDTVLFELPLSDPIEGEPFGPDSYGYVCFDNTDTSWFAVPLFEWIEIDPHRGGNGANTDMRDDGESNDHSVMIELPFSFQYYGGEFDRITICSNGWIAMGACQEINAARNRRLPGPECPPGMIAPFWDDLVIPQNSGVYTWYDEENHRFIVEWSGLKKLGPRGANEPTETFQAILFDPNHHPTMTGDGDIIFQYLDITDDISCLRDWDVPFASVGIASPDFKDGLEYTYWNSPAPGAAPLQDGLAIKFTTLVDFRIGALSGNVFDAATNRPIPEAIIRTNFGFTSVTDINGHYRIPEAFADTNYAVTASKRFFNPSSFPAAIFEAEETVIDFWLTHPEFALSRDSMEIAMLPDCTAIGAIVLSNDGNGPLTFTSRYGHVIDRDDPDDTWDLLRRFDLSASLDNPRIQAVAFVRDHWLVAGTRRGQEGPHSFYHLDRDGDFVNQFNQPDSVGGNFGFRDLEYANGMLWGVATDPYLYRLNPETGEVIGRWTGIPALNSIRCVTRNPESGYFYIAATTGNIYVVEIADNQAFRLIDSFSPVDPRDGLSMRKYGFGWFPDDPEGYSLYITATNEVPNNDPNHPDMAIFKVNPATRDAIFLTDLDAELVATSGGRCGMTITSSWSSSVYAFAAIVEDGGHDWLGIFELAPNTSWISYQPREGMLLAGQREEIVIEVNSVGLDTGEYRIMLDYIHDASPGFQRIPVIMDVVSELQLPPPDEAVPFEFGLNEVYPNPFNQTATIRFTLDGTGMVRLKLFDTSGREVGTVLERELSPGRHTVSLGAGGLVSGIYFCQLESGGRRAVGKLVLMR